MIPGAARVWRCPTSVRWLPRALAGAVLAAGVISARTLDRTADPVLASRVGLLVTLAAAALAWLVVRTGGIVRLEIRLGEDAVEVSGGRRERALEYRDVVALDFAAPMTAGRRWVPALTLLDRFDQTWPLPAWVDDPRALLRGILEHAGRTDLEVWAEARRIGDRLERAHRALWLFWALVPALPVAAILRAVL